MSPVRNAVALSALTIALLSGTALTFLPAVAQEAPVIDVTELSIEEVQAAFAAGTYTSEQLTQAFLDRIEIYEPFYNAFISMNPDALEEARAIDARRAAGEVLGPLAGVPVVVKEAMDFAGLPSTAGWAPLSSAAGGVDLIPDRDATVVARLRAAGAIVLGKTNIPVFSDSGTDANSSWAGPTFNGVMRSIAPGGSSAGSATAVAASFAVIALAEETGGSIQNPAGAQSLVGIKPTFGLVPNTGVVPLGGSTRDVVGPLARNVTDAALTLDVLAGYTPEDPKTVASIGNIPAGGYTAALSDTSLEGVRVGLYGPGWRAEDLSPETQALYEGVIAELEAQGATVVEDPFANSGFADLFPHPGDYDARGTESVAYDLGLWLSRFGPDAPAHTLAELQMIPGADPFGEGPLNWYETVLPQLAASLEDPTMPPDLTEFTALRQSYLSIFRKVMADNDIDVLVFPQVTDEAPGIFADGSINGTTVSEINISGLPGVIMPAGAYPDGAPFGIIFIGDLFTEGTLLSYAYDYEQATHHHIVPTLETTPYPVPAATP